MINVGDILSTHGGVQHRGDIMSTVEDVQYHEDIMIPVGDVMSTVGGHHDTCRSTVRGVQYRTVID